MDYHDRSEIMKISLNFQHHSAGWTSMIVIGAIILFFLTLPLLITGRYPATLNSSLISALVVMWILSLSFLVGGSCNKARLVKIAFKAISGMLSNAGTHAIQDSGSTSTWQPQQPRIPSSAFIPSPRDDAPSTQSRIPSSSFIASPKPDTTATQSRIPSSAFIPSPRENLGASKGREIPEDIANPLLKSPERICKYCGSPFPAGEDSRFCPSCGHPVGE
jgi:hypothetical protein